MHFNQALFVNGERLQQQDNILLGETVRLILIHPLKWQLPNHDKEIIRIEVK